LFGTALTPLRLVPALAMSATVALTADFACRLGGGRFAQALAGLCVLLAPALLAGGVLLSTDCLQALSWLACAWILVRLVDSGDERWWLAFGLVAGVSFESKYLILLYMAALAVGIVATPLRRSLTRPWLYVGAALALAIALPNVLWQAQHGWPFLGIAVADVGGKAVERSPLGFPGAIRRADLRPGMVGWAVAAHSAAALSASARAGDRLCRFAGCRRRSRRQSLLHYASLPGAVCGRRRRLGGVAEALGRARGGDRRDRDRRSLYPADRPADPAA
jgi:4-amino-4-deoxy-L-arabinose transferase-like glycosyltransferase